MKSSTESVPKKLSDPEAQFEIEESNFQTIVKIWSNHLWPGRESKIEPLSAISEDLSIDINIFKFKPYYLICKFNGSIVGVLSGHPTSSTSYRLRGLYVLEEFREKGVGKLLMQRQIDYAISLGLKVVWLLGRVHRESLYESLGFQTVCKTEKFEFGPHCLMKKNI